MDREIKTGDVFTSWRQPSARPLVYAVVESVDSEWSSVWLHYMGALRPHTPFKKAPEDCLLHPSDSFLCNLSDMMKELEKDLTEIAIRDRLGDI